MDLIVTWILLVIAILMPFASLVVLLPIAVEQTRRRQEAARQTLTVHMSDEAWREFEWPTNQPNRSEP